MSDDIFAGGPSRGAADAWHTMSLALEGAVARGQPAAPVAFDLYTAFDQLSKCTIYCIMLLAGMPPDI
eukprot:5531841-Alexandrium_andersonii.AAC.1